MSKKTFAHRPDMKGVLTEKSVPVRDVFERSRESARIADERRRNGSLPGPSSTKGQVRSIDPGAIGMFEPEKKRSPYWDDAAFRRCQRAEARRLNPPSPREKNTRTKKQPSIDELLMMVESLINELE